MQQDKKYIQFLEQNLVGRDFVVGDIHGCFDELMALLDYVKFDHSFDRLIAVGDLVDRGPKNLEVLDFFVEHFGKSVFSVKGNHDEMCEMFLSNFYRLEQGYYNIDSSLMRRNGSDWVDEKVRSKEVAQKYISFFKSMPYIIVVGKGTTDRYNVVHTEFIRKHPKPQLIETIFGMLPDPLQKFSGKVTDEMIDNWPIGDWKKNASIYSTYDSAFTWQRSILEYPINGNQQKAGKMSTTYSGHNSINTGVPGKIQQQIILDTGAGYLHFINDTSKCFLSLIDHKSGVVYKIGETMKVEETVVDLEWFDRIKDKMIAHYNKQLAKRKNNK